MEPDSACHLRKYIADMCYLFNKYDLASTWMGFSELIFIAVRYTVTHYFVHLKADLQVNSGNLTINI